MELKKEKNIKDFTYKEFLKMKYFQNKNEFTSFVIVPTKEIHYSGYRCMKFILIDEEKIVGVVGGYSDVIHFNGIGGKGKFLEDAPNPKGYAYKIDCLPKSGCLRVFIGKKVKMEVDDFIASDFLFYVKK